MIKYFIVNQRGGCIDISEDVVLKEFLTPKEDIVEHLKAQLVYLKEKNKDHKLQPIIVGIPEDYFVNVINHICKKYKGFWRQGLLNSNKISIRLNPKGSDVISIVNQDVLLKNFNND